MSNPFSEQKFIESEIKTQIKQFKTNFSDKEKNKCFEYIFHKYNAMCNWCYNKHITIKNGVRICKHCETCSHNVRVDIYIKKKNGGLGHWINETLNKVEIVC
jgi:hypothetical protein